MGKTGLVHNVFYHIGKSDPNAVCVYLDLFPTSNMYQFVAMLGKAVIGRASSLSQKAFDGLTQFFRSCSLVFSSDPISGSPQVSLATSDV